MGITVTAKGSWVEGKGVQLTFAPSSTTGLTGFIVHWRNASSSEAWHTEELAATARELQIAATVAQDWQVHGEEETPAATGTTGPPPPPAAELKLVLVNGGTEVEVASAPTAGQTVDFALCSENSGSGGNVLFEPKGVPVGGRVKGKVGHEWIDGKVTGGTEWWSTKHGRIKVTVAAPPPPPVEEPPVEPAGFHRGMNAGGWTRSQEVADAKKLGPSPAVRLENPSETTAFTSTGTAVVYLNSGGVSTASHFTPAARDIRARTIARQRLTFAQKLRRLFAYNTGGVKALSTSTVVADAVAVVKKHPDIVAYEYLNEPGGDWFWGGGADSQENATAYAKQSRAIYEAFQKEFGSKAPPLLLSFDGGHAGENGWGKKVIAADPTLFKLPGVIPTNHPYDGGSANPSSTLVHWGSVEETHALTGKWPAITEYGRPRESGTGDSPKSTEAQQAAADGAMVHAGKEHGCPFVLIFGYRAGNYGIFSSGDVPFAAVEAIRLA